MKTITKTVHFNAPPEDVYDYLINPKKFSKITGGKATNSMKEGGKFSFWDDYIWGTNVSLIPGKKIVQNWTCADFPDKHFSKVTFELEKKGEKQTELKLTHENVPDDLFEDLNEGWNHFYFEPIQDYIEDLMWN